jgi:hypothetical protein
VTATFPGFISVAVCVPRHGPFSERLPISILPWRKLTAFRHGGGTEHKLTAF